MVGQFNGVHPYEKAMDELFPGILLELMNQGRITQPEYQALSSEYMRAKPAYLSKINQFGQLSVPALREDMINTLVSRMLQRIRGCGNMNMGGGMVYPNGGSMFTGGVGMNPMYQQQMNPYSSQVVNPYSSQVFTQPHFQSTVVQQPAMSTPAPTAAPSVQETPAPVVEQTEWVAPEANVLISGKDFEDMGTLSLSAKYWNRSNGKVHLDVVAVENSLKYKSKEEMRDAVMRVPELMKNCESYTITVAYLQPVLLEVGMKEMQTLADELVREFGSSSGALSGSKGVANIAPFLNIIENKYTNALNREVVRFLCNEINLHQRAGELSDKQHVIPMIDIDNLRYLEMYASRAGLDEESAADINSINGFDAALGVLVAKVITPFLSKMKSFIIDPKASVEYLETYVNACPRYVTKDGQKYAAVPDIVKLYHQSKQHVSGSPTEGAKKAKLDFETSLGVLTSKYTVVYVPRVATITNLDPGQAAWYDDKDNLLPHYYTRATNDVSYFLMMAAERLMKMSSELFARAPHVIEFDNDEQSTHLMYGIGTDMGLWTGNTMYL